MAKWVSHFCEILLYEDNTYIFFVKTTELFSDRIASYLDDSVAKFQGKSATESTAGPLPVLSQS